MASQRIEQLREILTQESFKRRLREILRPVFGTPSDVDASGIGPILSGIYPKLDRPAAITDGEIFDAFWRSFISKTIVETIEDISVRRRYWIEERNFDRAFGRFVQRATNRVHVLPGPGLSRRPQLFPVAVTLHELEFPVENNTIVWQREDAFVELRGTGPGALERDAGDDFDAQTSQVIYASLDGSFSRRARIAAQREIAPVLRVIVSSWIAALHGHCLRYGRIGALGPNLPTRKQFHALITFWRQCLDIFYAPIAKADSFDRRIRNAMLLLAEADEQRNFAIGLSLCFSAMEAMLSEESANIVANLSENVAATLEPRREHRMAACKVVKDLYKIRSQVLHGSSLEHDPDKLDDARVLAACVLKAVVERREFERRLGGPSGKPAEFFSELKEARMSGRAVVGISKSTASRLWEQF